ncbi:MAG: glycosyltransferase family 4 protein [Sedimentisphaerales bacterium]|nr:glycosyltransferase family 4 protein [Sedimentisphaerales bacterium]
MKILMLNYEFPPIGGGGGQAHRSLLAQYAGRKDLTVDVLTSGTGTGLSVEQFADGITLHKVGIPKKDMHYWHRAEVIDWLLKAKPPYRRLLHEGSYDLVHAFFGFPTGWLCYRTAGRLPYIVSLRGSDVPGCNTRLALEYRFLGPLVFKPIWKHAARLVACSEGLKARALRFLPSVEIDVIPNGVDLARFSPGRAEPPGDEPYANTKPLRLLTVGRLSLTKRLPLLIEMMEMLHAEEVNATLTIVGGGALEAELRQSLGEKNLRDVVTIMGRRESDQMPGLYREHDVFVSASAQEGMSNAMLEAMASGLPIITTRCEGVQELIVDNGVVVDDPQPAKLAEAVKALREDLPLRRKMAVAARRHAERFGWDRVAQAYLQLYAEVK